MISHPSPNCGPRRAGARHDMVVLHYTAMASAEAALARLCDPTAEVSAHYLICERGRVWQMVDEAERAWHAGAGQWGDVVDVNSHSIGIELANHGDHPFAEAQMAALEGLLAGILQRWNIPPERVIGHSDMAPERKPDPGTRFDWLRLAKAGLSIWPAPEAAPDAAPDGNFLRDAQKFGYALPTAPPKPEPALLKAFRLRFRPWAKGPLTEEDSRLMRNLAQNYPFQKTPDSTAP